MEQDNTCQAEATGVVRQSKIDDDDDDDDDD